jgi:two-component system sensor histidine kinase KdpD
MRELAHAISLEQIVRAVVQNIGKSFSAEVAVLLAESNRHLSRLPELGSTMSISEKEQSVATWVLEHNRRAGRFTDSLPLSEALYLPLSTATGVIGVVGIKLPGDADLSLEQMDLLESLVQHTALVIDRQRLHEAAQESRLAAESERLSKTLLDSISHEMRTPIAAIISAASALGEIKPVANPQYADAMMHEIREAAARLDRLVGNLLDIARVESGHVQPKMDWHEVSDLIGVTLRELEKELVGRKVEVEVQPNLPLVQMDIILMEQVLTNLLLNAVAHTPAGRPIKITAGIHDDELILKVVDRGEGIPADARAHIFEKFYRVPGARTGGTGLGLSIVKGFVEAQKGRVEVGNVAGGGTAFTISLPITEQPIILPESA